MTRSAARCCPTGEAWMVVGCALVGTLSGAVAVAKPLYTSNYCPCSLCHAHTHAHARAPRPPQLRPLHRAVEAHGRGQGRSQLHHHLLQPQLCGAQRRQPRHACVCGVARDRDRVRHRWCVRACSVAGRGGVGWGESAWACSALAAAWGVAALGASTKRASGWLRAMTGEKLGACGLSPPAHGRLACTGTIPRGAPTKRASGGLRGCMGLLVGVRACVCAGLLVGECACACASLLVGVRACNTWACGLSPRAWTPCLHWHNPPGRRLCSPLASLCLASPRLASPHTPSLEWNGHGGPAGEATACQCSRGA